jgi:hypothetical protein
MHADRKSKSQSLEKNLEKIPLIKKMFHKKGVNNHHFALI